MKYVIKIIVEPAFKSYYPIKDYLELKNQVDYKIAFHEGEAFALAGGLVNHNRLSAKIGNHLDTALKNCKCAVFIADLMIGYNNENYFYPEASVICGKPKIYAENKNAAKNSCLMVEVLSN